jgi:hypothetical protein
MWNLRWLDVGWNIGRIGKVDTCVGRRRLIKDGMHI